jgi:integrase
MYRDRVSIRKKGHSQEKYRIDQMCRMPIADLIVHQVSSVDIAQFRDQRIATVNSRTGKPLAASTVRHDMALLSDMFTVGKIEWGICTDNPVANVRKPKLPPGRDRRLTPREENLILRYCTKRSLLEMLQIVQLGLETCMRQGEILALQWEHVNLKGRIVHLPNTKNGTKRDVPLTIDARDVLAGRGVQASGRVFSYMTNGVKSSWRSMIKKLEIEDLHFHDLRHEAISRLVERGVFDLLEIAAISGHKSLSMLKRYTHLRTQRLIQKLDAGKNRGRAAVLSQLVPYPAFVDDRGSEIKIAFPDFECLCISAPDVDSAKGIAQDALLRRLLILMRQGKTPPAPDAYLDPIDESQIVRLDPLANCE